MFQVLFILLLVFWYDGKYRYKKMQPLNILIYEGGDPKDGAGAERISPWDSEITHWETAAEREGRGMAIPLARGGHGGGGTNGHYDINPEKAEHRRAVHCYATASGPMRGCESERGSEGASKVVGTGGD